MNKTIRTEGVAPQLLWCRLSAWVDKDLYTQQFSGMKPPLLTKLIVSWGTAGQTYCSLSNQTL
jgi:hypothetical protein